MKKIKNATEDIDELYSTHATAFMSSIPIYFIAS